MPNKTTILIVDDITDNLKLLNEILSEAGYAVRPADNGELAIKSALSLKPDLVLLDVRMPVIDGFEVCRRLKSHSSTADIPVIFVSAFDELADRLRGFELGAVDFIVKPFEPKEVLARIHTQLEISRLRKELEKSAAELRQTNDLLQDKSEQIEVQNEELQCQTEELMVQNEEYQNQNAELLKLKKEIEKSEEKYRLLFENVKQGFALHEIILDQDQKPIDYRYLEINPAFEDLTGLKAENLIGKTIKEVMPQTEDYWLNTYGEVALTGKDIRYENYAKELNRYYEVWAFSPQRGQFAVIFSDITDRKRSEEELLKQSEELKARNEELSKFNDASMGRELKMVELKKEINELCKKLGEPERYSLWFLDLK